jgi:hypothetical protein
MTITDAVDRAISDDELTALALAADPVEQLDEDAVALGADAPFGELLPTWYMPSPVTNTRKRWHVVLAVLVIVGFVVINLFGLCITYGRLVVA